MCVYRRCAPGACLLNVPVGFQARKAVLCLLGLHSESNRSKVDPQSKFPAKQLAGRGLSRSKLKQAFLMDSDAEIFMYLIQCIQCL